MHSLKIIQTSKDSVLCNLTTLTASFALEFRLALQIPCVQFRFSPIYMSDFPFPVASRFKADSTRALKTRPLKRPTKRVATPTECSNEEIYKKIVTSSVYDCTVEDVEYICNSNSTLCLFYCAIFVVLLLS